MKAKFVIAFVSCVAAVFVVSLTAVVIATIPVKGVEILGKAIPTSAVVKSF